MYIYIYIEREICSYACSQALPDPGALNYGMRTFPENKCRMYYGLTHNSMHLDMGCETLGLKLWESKS